MSAGKTHICPPFCHRCPCIFDEILPWCYAMVNAPDCQDLNEICTCKPVCECGAPAEHDGQGFALHCTWPVEIMSNVKVEELVRGQICMNLAGSRRGIVADIQPPEPSQLNQTLLAVTISRIDQRDRPTGRVDEYQWDARAQVRVRRRVPCGAPMCFRHMRDLGDDFHFICADHWAAQLSEIAA